MTIIDRDDSTGRSRRLALSMTDEHVNVKVWNTGTGADLVVRLTPEELAFDLRALEIPGLTITYVKPTHVPQGIGAVVLDSAREPYLRQYDGKEHPHIKRPWVVPSRRSSIDDEGVRIVLEHGGRIITEGVEL
jgi:hypothetical protein